MFSNFTCPCGKVPIECICKVTPLQKKKLWTNLLSITFRVDHHSHVVWSLNFSLGVLLPVPQLLVHVLQIYGIHFTCPAKKEFTEKNEERGGPLKITLKVIGQRSVCHI